MEHHPRNEGRTSRGGAPPAEVTEQDARSANTSRAERAGRADSVGHVYELPPGDAVQRAARRRARCSTWNMLNMLNMLNSIPHRPIAVLFHVEPRNHRLTSARHLEPFHRIRPNRPDVGSTWNQGDAREEASPTQPPPSVPPGTSAIYHADHSPHAGGSHRCPQRHRLVTSVRSMHRPGDPSRRLSSAPRMARHRTCIGPALDLHRPHRCSRSTPTHPCEQRRDVPTWDRACSGPPRRACTDGQSGDRPRGPRSVDRS